MACFALARGVVLYAAPEHDETDFLCAAEIRKASKGTDASGNDDEEPVDSDEEFSDDEAEEAARQRRKIDR